MKDYQYAVYRVCDRTFFNPIHEIDKGIKIGDIENGYEVVFIGSLEDAEKIVLESEVSIQKVTFADALNMFDSEDYDTSSDEFNDTPA